VGIDVSAVPSNPAGAGRYTIELIKALADDDLEISLVARTGDEGRFAAFAPSAEVVAVVPSARPLRLAYEQIGIPRLERRLGIDVYHGPHYTMPLRSPVPAVVTIHDVTFFDHPELHERSKVAFFRRAIRSAAARASVLVCVSSRTADRLMDHVDPRCPVLIAPHGIDHVRFVPTEPSPGSDQLLLRAAGLDPSRSRLVAVGTVEPRKGFDRLVRAFDRLAESQQELELVIAGQRGWATQSFDDALAAARHRDRISVLGYVDDDLVPALLRTAGCVVYPSLDEGFGLPALEGLACGAAVVTTEGSVMAELCGPAAWLAPPDDVGVLGEVIGEALNAPTVTRSSRADMGRRRAQEFSWAATASRHVEAYRLAVGTAGREAAGG